ncbi:HD domain-containing protein [Candidatus Woesearchaeota archaeon]|nr:HD domain-containing protein [Candidatus Woesearchaeota archaeon]
MKDNRLTKIVSFLKEIEGFKTIYRRILLDKRRNESDAEHTWHLCMFGLLLNKELDLNLDLSKVFKLALLHDLPELYAGDTYAFDDEGKKTKAEREEKAAKELFGILPEDLGEELYKLFREYEECKSPEAKFVKAIDKIQPILSNVCTNGLTWKENKTTKETVSNYGVEYIQVDTKLKEMHKNLLKEAEIMDLFYS